MRGWDIMVMDDESGLWMLHAAPPWRQNLTRTLARQGLCELDARILHTLAYKSAPLLQKTLGAALGEEPSTLARSLQRLEQGGFLTRTPDKADRRAFAVGLTAQGTEIAITLQGIVRDAFAELFCTDDLPH